MKKFLLKKSIQILIFPILTSFIIFIIFTFLQHIGMNNMKYNNFNIYYHNISDSTEIKQICDSVYSLLNKNNIVLEKKQNIIICKTNTEFKIRTITFDNGILAKNLIFFNSIIFGSADIKKNILYAHNTMLNDRKLSSVITHELVHSYQLKKLGWFNYIFKEDWKIEGYAEYIAETSSAKYNDVLPLFMKNKTFENSINCDSKTCNNAYFYFISRLRTDFLFNYKKINEEKFWKTDFNLEKLDNEIRECIKTNQYYFKS